MLNVAGTCKPVTLRYTGHVTETTATELGSSTHKGGHRRLAVFFRPYALVRAFNYGGQGGDAFGRAGFLCDRSANPTFARHPSPWQMSGGLPTHKGGHHA